MNWLILFQIAMQVMTMIEALLNGPAGQQQTSPPVQVNFGGHIYQVDVQVTKVA